METADATPARQSSAHEHGGVQYLTFALHGEQYGIAILAVQEIKGCSATTPIPHTPDYVRGVMNLRGTVIPVIDLRVRFGLPAIEDDRFAVIVVVAVERRLIGLLVDAVSDVLDIPDSAVQPPPELGGHHPHSRCVAGTARVDDHLVVLLDVRHVLDADEPIAAAVA